MDGLDINQTSRYLASAWTHIAKRRLNVNEAISAVISVFAARKFLVYRFWVSPKGVIKRAVASKTQATFKQRVRQLTRRSAGCSL